jgi:hypothetical protein
VRIIVKAHPGQEPLRTTTFPGHSVVLPSQLMLHSNPSAHRAVHEPEPGQFSEQSPSQVTSQSPEPVQSTEESSPTSISQLPEPVQSTSQPAAHSNSQFPAGTLEPALRDAEDRAVARPRTHAVIARALAVAPIERIADGAVVSVSVVVEIVVAAGALGECQARQQNESGEAFIESPSASQRLTLQANDGVPWIMGELDRSKRSRSADRERHRVQSCSDEQQVQGRAFGPNEFRIHERNGLDHRSIVHLDSCCHNASDDEASFSQNWRIVPVS